MPAYETFKTGPRKGQPRTLQDRVIRYLTEGLGMVKTVGRSARLTFKDKYGQLYFLGSSGAVRTGRTVSTSRSVTDLYHAEMKLWEQTLPQTSGLVEVEL